MEIVGSIEQGEVPKDAHYVRNRPGSVWVTLAKRILADQKEGRITVIKVADDKERQRMQNGVRVYLRNAGYLLNESYVQRPDGLEVFLELVETKRQSGSEASRTDLGRLRTRKRA